MTERDLQKRIVTGVLLGVVALAAVLAGKHYFNGFLLIAVTVMVLEWEGLTRDLPRFYRRLGLAYILAPAYCLIILRTLTFPGSIEPAMGGAEINALPILHLIAIVVATDVGAYAIGRPFGRHKILPSVSPGKTWEGLAGGVLFAILASLLTSPVRDAQGNGDWGAMVGIVIALVAQLGDLFESKIKRMAGVKDSGTLLPGHGGMLDRFDGLLFAAPVYLMIALLSGGIIL